MALPIIEIRLPDWVDEVVDFEHTYETDDERMTLAVELALHNTERWTGGPFGAAIFEVGTGRLVSVGVNLVVPNHNSMLHAEVVACMMAEARLQSFTLKVPSLPAHELVTSCEPCAMCLGATLWAGIRRIVCGATRTDAAEIFFDEGPVFPESWDYLRERGVEIVREVLRDEARTVLLRYAELSGTIYNG
ncbi:MAG: nucleoside deaminase [Longimicrobiales bacterium]